MQKFLLLLFTCAWYANPPEENVTAYRYEFTHRSSGFTTNGTTENTRIIIELFPAGIIDAKIWAINTYGESPPSSLAFTNNVSGVHINYKQATIAWNATNRPAGAYILYYSTNAIAWRPVMRLDYLDTNTVPVDLILKSLHPMGLWRIEMETNSNQRIP